MSWPVTRSWTPTSSRLYALCFTAVPFFCTHLVTSELRSEPPPGPPPMPLPPTWM
ncbi:hypothetical protein SALBM311S_08818 [Streptomyces alboniger]